MRSCDVPVNWKYLVSIPFFVQMHREIFLNHGFDIGDTMKGAIELSLHTLRNKGYTAMQAWR